MSRARLPILCASAALALAAAAPAAHAFPASPEFAPAPVGRAGEAGSHGGLVARLQAALDRQGFNAGPADGVMGFHTRRAIEAYQRSHGLRVTGRPTRELLARIEGNGPAARQDERREERRDLRHQNRRAERRAPGGIVARDRVRAVQEALDRRGYRAGPPDGVLGPATRRAIVRYRRDAHLPPGPEITPRLLSQLRVTPGARDRRHDHEHDQGAFEQRHDHEHESDHGARGHDDGYGTHG